MFHEDREKLAADFAPGLPDPSRFGDPRNLPVGSLVPWVVQKHDAQRAGTHFDVRFGPDDLYSWATRKEFPKPGAKPIALYSQPLHSGAYADFTGELRSGYGKGTVSRKDRGQVLITEAGQHKIKFVVAHKGEPEMFTLVRMTGQPRGGGRTRDKQGGTWLMFNTTPSEAVPGKKVSYRAIPAEQVDKLFDPKYVMSHKIDGACFPAATRVLTNVGWLRIGDIVNYRLPVRVASRDEAGELVWRKVTNFWKKKNPMEGWVSLRCWAYPRKAVYLACTSGHKILTPGGMRQAVDLCVGDSVYVLSDCCGAQQEEVLLGCLLGDGSLRKDGSLVVSQCDRRRAFVEWLFSIFSGPEGKHACFLEGTGKPTGYGGGPQVRLKTSRMFKALRHTLYAGGTKEFSQDALSALSPLALAVWFGCDGAAAYAKNGRCTRIELCTDGFSEATVRVLASELSRRYSLRFHVHRRAGKSRADGLPRFVLTLYASSDTDRFFKIIAAWLHPVFAYKLRGSRWAVLVGSKLSKLKAHYVEKLVPSKIDLIRKTPDGRGHFGKLRNVYDIEVSGTHNYLAEGVVVSNSAFVKLMKDHVDILSYRASTSGAPIVHTQRLGLGAGKVDVPKKYQGTVLRGEAWAERKGKAIPARELGGLLNSSVANALATQKREAISPHVALFGVEKHDGLSTKSPIDQQRALIQEVLKFLPSSVFHEPEYAYSEDEKRKMWERVTSGKDPRTAEGVVGFPAAGGVPAKVKPTKESDVWIREVFPQTKGKLKGRVAGGFRYALSPDPAAPVVGEVGTGFDAKTKVDMLQNPDKYVGRLARVTAQEQFPSGAWRSPAYVSRHEDYPLAKTAVMGVKTNTPQLVQPGGMPAGKRGVLWDTMVRWLNDTLPEEARRTGGYIFNSLIENPRRELLRGINNTGMRELSEQARASAH